MTLGVALPKGDRQKWLVEKVVELGVAKLVPLETERGVAQPVENALERSPRGDRGLETMWTESADGDCPTEGLAGVSCRKPERRMPFGGTSGARTAALAHAR